MATIPARPRQTSDGIRRINRVWGRHPWLYSAQDRITFMGHAREIRQAAVSALRAGAGARVLEVGCGTGRNFAAIEVAIGPDGELVGLDVTPEMLAAPRRLCGRRGWHNIRLAQGDAARLDVGDERFAGVLFAFSLSVIPVDRPGS
jgi:ubiquinone/menaquinone biosynthesis C-methylase UbiE